MSRKNPHGIIVLIPDYTASHLGSFAGKLFIQLKEFNKAVDNPDFAMQYLPQPNPYVYYDAIRKNPVINDIGRMELQRQIDFINTLREEETEAPHAFIRCVLRLYGKEIDCIEKLSITYNEKADCIDRICTAWDIFKASERGPSELKVLKEALKSACNETKAYPKALNSNIQIDTINDILRFAGITETVSPERKVHDIN